MNYNILHELRLMGDNMAPSINSIKAVTEKIFYYWPELENFKDSIYIVFASCHNQYHFLQRDKKFIKLEILNAYNNNKRHFFFAGLDEGFITNTIKKINEIKNDLKEQISEAKIYYVVSIKYDQNEYDKVCEKYNLDKNIKLITALYFEHISKDNFIKCLRPYRTGVRDKKFLCYNRIQRHHRMVLLDKMLESELFYEGYYSIIGDDYFLEHMINQSNFATAFPNIVKNKHLLPVKLNVTKERENPNNIIENDIIHFENSYFSIVTETNFYNFYKMKPNKFYINQPMYENFIFFSEKVFKPIAMKHPFILLSSSGALEFLREIGYKTFSPFIDESYDSIEDDDFRLTTIFNEVKRLCNLSTQELIKFTENIKEIVEYNYQVFFNKTDYRYTKNIDELMVY